MTHVTSQTPEPYGRSKKTKQNKKKKTLWAKGKRDDGLIRVMQPIWDHIKI